jgi:chemotaxis-related protein WspB
MLHLLMQLRDELYALPASCVVEVIPAVPLLHLPQAPPYVAGLLSFRGTVVPVLDLAVLTHGGTCPPTLSTRIVVVELRAADGARRVIGLRAERVTDTEDMNEQQFVSSGLAVAATPHLAGVARTARGLVQRVSVEQVIPQAVRDSLFADVARAAERAGV